MFHSSRTSTNHVSGIPDVRLTGWLGPALAAAKRPFHVIGPTGAKNLMANLYRRLMASTSVSAEPTRSPPQGIAVQVDEFDKDGVKVGPRKTARKVIAFEVDHGDLIKPVNGYRIEYKGHAAVISGDTRSIKRHQQRTAA